MTAPVIKVRDLWKEYAVGGPADGHYSTFYDVLASTLKLPLRGARRPSTSPASRREKFWALKDINFDVHPGDVVGVIGRNGAGKSTLLKILSRITAPTRGRVELRGRLASLLEVGTGFHPELSGRENIYLNGSILGMPRDEVTRNLDSIVEFAEVQKFIDTPVKHYSSGMYVRLAFSVAAHLDPDILIVDEVLAVGDADFQRKCIGQMESISKQGRTLLVVSHNMQLIQKLCPTAILLDKGGILAAGRFADVQPKYLAGTQGNESAWSPDRSDEHPFQYERIEIVPPAGYSASALPADQQFEIEFRFRVSVPVSGRLALKVRNQFGVVVFTSADTDGEAFLNRRWQPGEYVRRCSVQAGLMVPGQYWLTVSRPLGEADEILEDICTFMIDRMGSLTERDNREGVIAPLLRWHEGGVA